MTVRYRLGLDLGTNSIGWAAVALDPEGRPGRLLDGGVRIITPNDEAGRDPKSKASLAAGRRAARAMRRRRDRFLRRQKRLMEILIASGLMPADAVARKDLEKLDPYWLRARALSEPLTLYEIGRALFHLNQRRGFSSNRITDADDAEGSAMKQGMAQLQDALEQAGARTLGEFLAKRHRRDREGYRVDLSGQRISKANGNDREAPQGVRFRPHAEGSKLLYDFYPTRDMVAHELRQILAAQAKTHPELTEALCDQLEHIIIAQRPLKKPRVGRCTFRPDEERAPRALPLFQRFRILSELAALEIERPGRPARKLTVAERDLLANLLGSQTSLVTFTKMAKTLKLPDDADFNLARGGRKGLDPDKTAAILAKTGKGESFGKGWRSIPFDQQSAIVQRLLDEPDEDALISFLIEECGLSEEKAQAASAARLPQGHGHIGPSMLEELVDVLQNDSIDVVDPQTGEILPTPLTYDQAVVRLGSHHSHFTGERRERLPYYGEVLARHVIANPDAPDGSQERIGRVPNPTVHIALNQTAKLVNALIEAHGRPDEIVIELARELKQNRQQKDEAIRQNRSNETERARMREELVALGFADTPGNMLLLRLYAELPPDERVCVYSGEPISKEVLFSGAIDIDHILPRSKTLDDGFANKVLCTREMNRRKGNRAPADAWNADELLVIHERSKRLFPRKAWRFAPDAMEKYAENNDFLARHLTDSQHMARLAKTYLGTLYGEDAARRVWSTPGRLTAMLRGMWGLNGLLKDHNRAGPDGADVKNRDDHRHHFLDAFVIACTDRGTLQRVATASARAEALEIDRWAEKGAFPEPFEGYRDQVFDCLGNMVVSHKADHGIAPGRAREGQATSGQLHEDTAYGAVDEQVNGKTYNLVTRKPIAALTKNEIGQVRDVRIREALQDVAYEADRDGIKLGEALARFGEEKGIRRVRVLKTDKSAVALTHGDGRFHKTYVPGDNHRLEIYVAPDGSWTGEAVTVFDANRKDFTPAWQRTTPRSALIMRLHKGDLVEADFGEGRSIWRVVRLEPSSKRVRLVRDFDAGAYEERHNDTEDPFRWNFATYARLQAAAATRVRVDPIGRVHPVREH